MDGRFRKSQKLNGEHRALPFTTHARRKNRHARFRLAPTHRAAIMGDANTDASVGDKGAGGAAGVFAGLLSAGMVCGDAAFVGTRRLRSKQMSAVLVHHYLVSDSDIAPEDS